MSSSKGSSDVRWCKEQPVALNFDVDEPELLRGADEREQIPADRGFAAREAQLRDAIAPRALHRGCDLLGRE